MSAIGREVLVITHFDGADLSWLDVLIREQGMEPVLVRPFAGELLPEPENAAAVICLGGPQNAYEDPKHPFLIDEQKFLRRAVHEHVPVLGICLGSQILATALGGQAIRGSRGLECGFIDVLPEPNGPGSEAAALHGRFFSFHTDSFIPPPEAELLATSNQYPQAWRLGSALAIQFHPEISPAGVRQLLSIEETKLRDHGVDVDGLLTEAESAHNTSWAEAQRVVGGWLANPSKF
ncbi:type 1 glutamine amidotransferase [Pseudarthrobacter sp. B4EP4b]|uniref:type 1 glutamine amidotransferase n=1 Tax=Pseudarthrobacter sp. B4EP4b TaxID=2590664 RepID=UPI001150293D|nr:type 1 glutamine amidotransferase [Pseudarthrobacter sp. B4EP4b]